MGLENRVVYDLNDVVEGRCTIEQVLVKDKRIDGLSLLPSCKSLSFENLDTEIMNSLIERLNKDYDFIIVDSPAGVEKGFQYSASLANEAINMIINKVNVDDIEGARSLTVEDAQEILSLPLLGIVYDSHDMIEANNRGVPIFLNNQHLLHSCFVNISKRILGQQVPYAKYKKKSLIRRFFYS